MLARYIFSQYSIPLLTHICPTLFYLLILIPYKEPVLTTILYMAHNIIQYLFNLTSSTYDMTQAFKCSLSADCADLASDPMTYQKRRQICPTSQETKIRPN